MSHDGSRWQPTTRSSPESPHVTAAAQSIPLIPITRAQACPHEDEPARLVHLGVSHLVVEVNVVRVGAVTIAATTDRADGRPVWVRVRSRRVGGTTAGSRDPGRRRAVRRTLNLGRRDSCPPVPPLDSAAAPASAARHYRQMVSRAAPSRAG